MSPAADLEARATSSPLFAKYGTRHDPESAREKLGARMEAATKEQEAEAREKELDEAVRGAERRERTTRRREPASTGNPVLDMLSSKQGQAIGKEIVRGVFGMLKKRR